MSLRDSDPIEDTQSTGVSTQVRVPPFDSSPFPRRPLSRLQRNVKHLGPTTSDTIDRSLFRVPKSNSTRSSLKASRCYEPDGFLGSELKLPAKMPKIQHNSTSLPLASGALPAPSFIDHVKGRSKELQEDIIGNPLFSQKHPISQFETTDRNKRLTIQLDGMSIAVPNTADSRTHETALSIVDACWERKSERRVSFDSDVYRQLASVTAPAIVHLQTDEEVDSDAETNSEESSTDTSLGSHVVEDKEDDDLDVKSGPVFTTVSVTDSGDVRRLTNLTYNSHSVATYMHDEPENHLNRPGQIARMKSSGVWKEVHEDIIDDSSPCGISTEVKTATSSIVKRKSQNQSQDKRGRRGVLPNRH